MNYETCKNCEHYTTCDIFVNHKNRCVPKYCKSFLFARLIAEQMKEEVRTAFFRLLEPGKSNDCPFMAEHSINDWNIKVEQGNIKKIREKLIFIVVSLWLMVNLKFIRKNEIEKKYKETIRDIIAESLIKILDRI